MTCMKKPPSGGFFITTYITYFSPYCAKVMRIAEISVARSYPGSWGFRGAASKVGLLRAPWHGCNE